MFTKMLKIFFISSIILICIFSSFSAEAKTTYNGTNDDFEYIVNDDGDGNKFITLTKYIGNDTTVIVPEKIDGYPINYTEQTFKNNTAIQRVEFSNGITEIGTETFFGCSNLKEVILPETVRSLNGFAFAYSGIPELILPAGIHYVGEGCFFGCKDLTFIKSEAKLLPFQNYSVYFDMFAFYDCGVITIQIHRDGFVYHHNNAFNADFRCLKSPSLVLAYRNNFTRPIVDFLFSLNIYGLLAVIFLFISSVVCILCLLRLIIRLIMRIFGKDMLLNYKKYSNDFIGNLQKQEENYILYSNDNSLRTRAIKKIKVFALLLVVIVWLFSYFVVADNFNYSDYFGFDSDFLNQNALLAVYFLVTGLLIILITIIYKIIKKIRDKRSSKKYERIKIRKVGKNHYDK